MPGEGVASEATLILAHGAGAPQTHPFMVEASRSLAARGLAVVTFNFTYMDEHRRVPDRAPVLERTWLDVISYVAGRDELPQPCVIGGKSMGGRIASHVATTARRDAGDLRLVPDGLVLLGYPLHPPGRPEQRRDAHLSQLVCPALFVQGTRDAFGTPQELEPVLAMLGDRATLHAVEQGDHSFAVPKAAGRARRDVLGEVWDVVAAWVKERGASRR
jgi:predicted alpha/beta-hydrolase family hydrolase